MITLEDEVKLRTNELKDKLALIGTYLIEVLPLERGREFQLKYLEITEGYQELRRKKSGDQREPG